MKNNIKRLMAKKGMTLDDVSKKARVVPSAISMIANEKREPMYSTAIAIAAALGEPIGSVFKHRKSA